MGAGKCPVCGRRHWPYYTVSMAVAEFGVPVPGEEMHRCNSIPQTCAERLGYADARPMPQIRVGESDWQRVVDGLEASGVFYELVTPARGGQVEGRTSWRK